MPDRLRILLIVIVALGMVVAVRMIHRRRLNLSYSLLWLALAVLLMIFALFPEAVAFLARLAGIDIPLNFVLVAFAFFSLVMMFYLTCIVSRENERNRSLTQTIALLEKRVRELEERQEGLLRRIHILALQQNEQKKN